MSTDETWRRLARKLREELGELIYGALNNPKVIEVLLNCPAGGGPRPPSPAGGGRAAPAPAQAGSAYAAPMGQPAAAAAAPKSGGQASQPAQAEPRDLLLSTARRRLRSVAVHLLSLQAPVRPSARPTRPMTVPRLPLRPSLPFQPRTPRGRQPKTGLHPRPTPHLRMLPPEPPLRQAASRSRPPLEPCPVTPFTVVRPEPPKRSASLLLQPHPRRRHARLSLSFPPWLHSPLPTFLACP